MKMKKHRFWVMIALVLCLALLGNPVSSSRAEDCFTLDVDLLDMDSLNSDEYVAQHLSAQTQGIRVQKYISDTSELAARVRLTLLQVDTNTLLFDKDYGYQSGTFDSGVIYLPFVDNRTIPYLVTLYVENYVFAMPFMHLQPRLSYNGACTYGARLRDLDAGLSSDWLMGTMVDLDALRSQGSQTVSVCASNAYVIGQATLTLQGDFLSVQLSFLSAANVEVHRVSLFVITDCASLTTADIGSIGQPSYSPGDSVSVAGASSALLYMPMQVSFDPVGLNGFGYDLSSGELQYQLGLWNQNRNQAYLTPATEPPPADGGPADPAGEDGGSGWTENSGAWDEGSGWVDDGSLDENAGWVDGDSSWINNSGWVDDGSLDENAGWVDGDSSWDNHSGWVDDGSLDENAGWVDDGASWENGPGSDNPSGF